jgi:hypothetical protein
VKLFALMIGTVILSTSAFGFSARNGQYTGGGTWRTPQGETGKWTVSTTVKHSKKGVLLKETLTIHTKDKKEVEENEWALESSGNGYYKALVRGTEAGTAYCHRNQCHVELTKGDAKSEETFTFFAGRIFRLGSDTSPKFSVSWQGEMHKSWRSLLRPRP